MRRFHVWDCFAFAGTLIPDRLLDVKPPRTDFDQQLGKID